jgi:hypothetical protein
VHSKFGGDGIADVIIIIMGARNRLEIPNHRALFHSRLVLDGKSLAFSRRVFALHYTICFGLAVRFPSLDGLHRRREFSVSV